MELEQADPFSKEKPVSISVLHNDEMSGCENNSLRQRKTDFNKRIFRIYIPFGNQSTPRTSEQFSYFYYLKTDDYIKSDQVLRFLLDHMQIHYSVVKPCADLQPLHTPSLIVDPQQFRIAMKINKK